VQLCLRRSKIALSGREGGDHRGVDGVRGRKGTDRRRDHEWPPTYGDKGKGYGHLPNPCHSVIMEGEGWDKGRKGKGGLIERAKGGTARLKGREKGSSIPSTTWNRFLSISASI